MKAAIAIALTACLCLSAQCAKAPEGWVRFDGLDHVAIDYPAGWEAGGKGTILSVRSPMTQPVATGMGIAADQVNISVEDHGKAPEATVARIEEFYLHDPTPGWDKAIVILSQREIADHKGQCDRLKETVVRIPTAIAEDLPPGVAAPNFVHAIYVCDLRGRIISVATTGWEDDERQAFYRDTAFAMAKSLTAKF